MILMNPNDQSRIQELETQIQLLNHDNQTLRAENRDLSQEMEKLKQRRQELENKLSIHAQSGLPTHFKMDLELKEILDEQIRERKSGFSLIILQLNQSYDTIKKTLKSSVSEWVLYQLACRIQETILIHERVYHTRDNEFIIICFRTQPQDLLHYLQDLHSRLIEPHYFSGMNILLEGNMGVAQFPQDGMEKGQLLHCADIAVGAALEQNRPFLLYHPSLKEQVIEKAELQNSIIKAIEAPAMAEIGRQFEMYYQPKLTISEWENTRVRIGKINAESLIRWNHPSKGLISPHRFIPLAEETGLILPMGKWILYNITSLLKKWIGTAFDRVGISVNLSARQFKSDDIWEIFHGITNQNALNTERITVEITETSVFEDPLAAVDLMNKFKALGVKLSVDDFGTGYSSLSLLHRFPLNEIKVDKSFIENFTSNAQDQIIVRSLVNLSAEMGLELVAEGVETIETLKMLYDMGCKTIQGWIFSPALREAELEAFISRLDEQNGWIELKELGFQK